MKGLPRLLAHYNAIDGQLDDDLNNPQNSVRRQSVIEDRQKANDHAYFVLCWGQLEVAIDVACRNAIRKRIQNPDWSKRRAWDLYNPEEKRLSGLSFEERATLVLDKGAGLRSEWQLVMKYYTLRNQIAHGGSHEVRIDLNGVAKDFYRIQSKLAP